MRKWIKLKMHHLRQEEMFEEASQGGRWEQISALGPWSFVLPFNHVLVSKKHTLAGAFQAPSRVCSKKDCNPPLWITKSRRTFTLLPAGKYWTSYSFVRNPSPQGSNTQHLEWQVPDKPAGKEDIPQQGTQQHGFLFSLGKTLLRSCMAASEVTSIIFAISNKLIEHHITKAQLF